MGGARNRFAMRRAVLQKRKASTPLLSANGQHLFGAHGSSRLILLCWFRSRRRRSGSGRGCRRRSRNGSSLWNHNRRGWRWLFLHLSANTLPGIHRRIFTGTTRFAGRHETWRRARTTGQECRPVYSGKQTNNSFHVCAPEYASPGGRLYVSRVAQILFIGNRPRKNRSEKFHCGSHIARGSPGRHEHYAKYWPPFAVIVEPVMNPALSDARNVTQRAISSGSPKRPTGISGRIFLSSTSCGMAFTISVAI